MKAGVHPESESEIFYGFGARYADDTDASTENELESW